MELCSQQARRGTCETPPIGKAKPFYV